MSKRTLIDLRRAKTEGQRIVVVTAYDHATARVVDAAGVDAILVGESLMSQPDIGQADVVLLYGDQLLNLDRAARDKRDSNLVTMLHELRYEIREQESRWSRHGNHLNGSLIKVTDAPHRTVGGP